ncbi:MAG: PilZ domain-containing protein [Armatimonadota bacterium]|nr:PilZ domain-containing protein [Armatimonadota bacterium]MDR7548383.1 PilZ domain-containing protein [Armatimonadota bacterium]
MERRALPRIPLAVPVRYATDQGHTGVGVLIDVHEQGAGLLVPTISPDVFHVWVQFLWFNDRMGVQGRVAFVRETPDGFRVGLQLQHVNGRSVRFITDYLIPFGLRKFRYDRRHPLAFLEALSAQQREATVRHRRRYLPVLVEQGGIKAWAVTEDRNEQGAVLLLPQAPQTGTPLTVSTWGSLFTRSGRAERLEPVELPSVRLYRVVVRFDEETGAHTTRPPAEARPGATSDTTF